MTASPLVNSWVRPCCPAWQLVWYVCHDCNELWLSTWISIKALLLLLLLHRRNLPKCYYVPLRNVWDPQNTTKVLSWATYNDGDSDLSLSRIGEQIAATWRRGSQITPTCDLWSLSPIHGQGYSDDISNPGRHATIVVAAAAALQMSWCTAVSLSWLAIIRRQREVKTDRNAVAKYSVKTPTRDTPNEAEYKKFLTTISKLFTSENYFIRSREFRLLLTGECRTLCMWLLL